MDDPMRYKLRVISIAIVTSMKFYSSKSFHFFMASLGAIFQPDNSRPYVAKTDRDFCSAQHMQLLPTYSPDMTRIENVWDLFGWCLTRDPCPAA
ncbi:hypothetical protein TNCV_4937141 [Trichonephila clavipes]|nr:hypothetical protein TNCV_4937141 [Trichonephila clavipes]